VFTNPDLEHKQETIGSGHGSERKGKGKGSLLELTAKDRY